MISPDLDEEIRLHARLVDGDPLATTDIAVAYMDELVKALSRAMPRPKDELNDAAVDALMKLFKRPSIFDPKKGRLLPFLLTLAKHGLLDTIRSRRSGKKRDEDYGNVVELPRAAPFNIAEMRTDVKNAVLPRLAKVVPEDDWPALELIVEGERSTEVLARAWGLPATLSVEERQAEVKRRRDRVMKALERVGEKLANDAGGNCDEDT